MDPADGRAAQIGGSFNATRSSHAASLRALHVAEYALSAPAPRRERTWLHRLTIAVDALADAIDRQIADNDNSLGLLGEIALSEPEHIDAIFHLRNEQRALRVATASLREQLDERPELPIEIAGISERFTALAHQFRQHHAREAELIHATLGIDITQPPQQRLG